MNITPELVKDKACAPGLKWLIDRHPFGLELDALIEDVKLHGDMEWLAWFAENLELPMEKKINLAKQSGPKGLGNFAVKSTELTQEQRLKLLKDSAPGVIGQYIKTHPGAPAWLLNYCDDLWKRKLCKMISKGLIKLSSS